MKKLSKLLAREIKAAGSAASLARQLELNPSTVQRWTRQGVPEAQQQKLEDFARRRRMAKKVSKKERAHGEREEQRRSFAYGNTKISNDDMTREAIDTAAEDLGRDEQEEQRRIFAYVPPAITLDKHAITFDSNVVENVEAERRAQASQLVEELGPMRIPSSALDPVMRMRKARRLHKLYGAGPFRAWVRDPEYGLAGHASVGKLATILRSI